MIYALFTSERFSPAMVLETTTPMIFCYCFDCDKNYISPIELSKIEYMFCKAITYNFTIHLFKVMCNFNCNILIV